MSKQILGQCRPATKDDAHELAELVNFAGEGLPVYLWSKSVSEHETVWDIGRQRACRETGGFSYRNATVFEKDNRVMGALIGYPIPDEVGPIDPGTPPMFLPLEELEAQANGTWYVNVLAAYPDCRGQGIGGTLLDIAEKHAEETNRRGLSIIVSDANDGARRLYERKGYREAGSRPMVKETWENRGENWVLLTKV